MASNPPTDLACPSCGNSLHRIPRLFMDRLLSKFAPRRRYRCPSIACAWEGTRMRPAGAEEDTVITYHLL